MTKHEWYVIGAHESIIGKKNGWADLELECIDDHKCGKKASVIVNINTEDIME